MQIRVGTTVSQPRPRTIPASLPGPQRPTCPNPVRTRYITLNEIDANGDLEPEPNGVAFREPPSDRDPKVGAVEDWVYVNMTGRHPPDAHAPGHLPGDRPHTVRRRGLRGGRRGPNGVPGGIDPPHSRRARCAARPDERGFKDTVKANPGYFTRIRAKFELPTGVTAPQNYVYHCHIVEHEDNDMMRPFTVTP